MNRIRTNFILNTISQVFRIITPFITTPYISRVLGVDNIGIFSYSQSYQLYFGLIAVLGTAAYGSREIARVRDDRLAVTQTFWEISILRAFTTAFAILGWSVLVCLQTENQIIFLILTTYVLASFFDISWFYMGLEKFPEIVAKTIIVRIAEVICIFLFVNSKEDLPLYCIIMGGGMLLGNITLWMNLKQNVDSISSTKLHPWHHLKGTIVYFLPSIATTIYTVLDKTLIGAITKSTYESGIYEQTTKVIEIAKAITFTSLNTVLSPRSSYLYFNKQYEKIQEYLSLSIEIMLFIGFGFCFGISAIANRFVPIFFGEEYSGTILLLRLLSPIIIIITISNALGDQYYNPAGLRLKTSIYLMLGAFTNLLLNLVLIPKYQSVGAIIATVVAESLITALYLLNCNKIITMKRIFAIAWKKVIAGLLMACFILFLDGVMPYTIFGLISIIFIGGIIYVVLLFVLKDQIIIFIRNELLSKISNRISKQSV